MLARHFKIYTLTILYKMEKRVFIFYYIFLFTPIRYIVIVEPTAPTKPNLVMDPSSEIRLSKYNKL